jgi:aminoglycoside phosphotransferase (APT) family kinase protein
MDAVAGARAGPIAPLIGYEPDASVLGSPFFVMGFVDGEVPRENPLYTQSGFFVDATPEQRARLVDDGLRLLARFHELDWRAAGLDFLVDDGVTPGTARQLEVWEQYAIRELDGRVHPGLERALPWLHAHLPTDERLVLCWGDSRPGNIIWQDFRGACLTDFEAASIASPDQDLGWWLMFDRWSHESFGAERLAGEPDRDEQRRRYAEYAGRPVPDTTFHEVFAAARYAAIVVRVMNRTVARGLMPPDQTIWLENPASTCLEQLLAEL